VALGFFIVLGAALPDQAQASIARDAVHTLQADKQHALYIMRNGVLTVLCALAAYQCWSLHRKRTGR
ncbi:hypothetical protein QDR58_22815, partial [Xanthomonas perforans]|nr:hypothetical protein [Xanthomonas perforans]